MRKKNLTIQGILFCQVYCSCDSTSKRNQYMDIDPGWSIANL